MDNSESADKLVGKVIGHQPDWFRESMGTLKPLLQSRNCASTKWLASRKGDDMARFKQASIIARKAVRAAKNSWSQEKVKEAVKEPFGGKKFGNSSGTCNMDIEDCYHQGLW